MFVKTLQQIIVRLMCKSPKSFRVVNWICNVCLMISGVQELLEMFSVTLPEPYNYFTNWTFIICTGIVRFCSGLTVDKRRCKRWQKFKQNETQKTT